MKKIFMSAFLALMLSLNTMGAFAAGVGYIDYTKVSTQYSLAKKYTAELDKKVTAVKNYAAEQDKKIKAAKTEAEKKTLRAAATKQIQAKQQEYVTTRDKYEAELIAKVIAAAEKVRASKRLDIIIKKDNVVTGGIDCTQDVLNILK